MSRNRRLISTMIKNNVAVLYIDNNAYVSAKTVEENRLIARQVAGAEAFAYKYLASYGVENESVAFESQLNNSPLKTPRSYKKSGRLVKSP